MLVDTTASVSAAAMDAVGKSAHEVMTVSEWAGRLFHY